MTEPSPTPVRRRRSKGYTWLQHGSNRQSELERVGWGVIALVVGLAGMRLVADRVSTPLGAFGATAVLWVALVATVALAYRTSKPKKLFKFSRNDLVIGVSLGLLLRFGADALQWRNQGFLAWPTFTDANGNLPSLWWLEGVLTNAVFSPLVEEYFFRAFLLVALYTAIRRFTGSPLASAVAATLVTSGLFLLAHLVAQSFTMSTHVAVTTVVFSIVASALVFITGRFWSAVVLHVTFNGTWVLIALVGSIVGAGGSAPGLS